MSGLMFVTVSRADCCQSMSCLSVRLIWMTADHPCFCDREGHLVAMALVSGEAYVSPFSGLRVSAVKMGYECAIPSRFVGRGLTMSDLRELDEIVESSPIAMMERRSVGRLTRVQEASLRAIWDGVIELGKAEDSVDTSADIDRWIEP